MLVGKVLQGKLGNAGRQGNSGKLVTQVQYMSKKTQRKYSCLTVPPMKGNGTGNKTKEYFKSTLQYFGGSAMVLPTLRYYESTVRDLAKVFEGTSVVS